MAKVYKDKPAFRPRYICISAYTPEALVQELNAHADYKPLEETFFFSTKFYLILELRRR